MSGLILPENMKTPFDKMKETVTITLMNLKKFFGEPIQISLICRHVSDEKVFMIFSDDSYPKLIEALQRAEKMRIQKQATAITVDPGPG